MPSLPADGLRRGRLSIERAGLRRRRRQYSLGACEPLEARALLTAIAVDDSYRLIQGHPLAVTASGVATNDAFASGNAVAVTSSTTPAHGSLSMHPDGTFTYTPAAGYSGPDSFGYTISDGLSGTDNGVVSLNILPSVATEASIAAGPRLASVNSARGPLLNALLGNLLGTSLNVNAVDWNAIAQGQVGTTDFLAALRTELGVATTGDALNAQATLAQVVNAAATVAQADGNTALVGALNGLGAQVGGLAGTIRVGDLLQVDPNDGSLADADLNALDLVTGGVQLFNFANVLTTTAPITVSGAALGLGSVLNSVQLSAQVVEPPVYVVGGVGTTFHTAATRLRLDLDLVDLNLDPASLDSSLLGPLRAAFGPLVTVQSNVSLGQISLYAEVASGTGTLTAIDAITGAVTLQGTPGVADVYLGTVPDAVFFDRTHAIVPADITAGTIGTIGIQAEGPSGTTLVDSTTGIAARSVALGQSPLANSITYNGPFPETETFASGAAFLSNLASTLTDNLQVSLTGPLGVALDPLVNSAILPAVRPLVANALAPVLTGVLTGVVDPTLELLGIGIGEMVATVEPLLQDNSPVANGDFAATAEDTPVTVAVLGDDVSVPANSATVAAVSRPAHGTAVINPDGTVTYTPAPNYNGPDSFTYTITDVAGGTSTATVSLQVTAVNDAPVANPDAYAAQVDTPLVVAGPGVLANDSDPDGNPIGAVLVTPPAHGTVTLNVDGSFTYTPATGYSGPDAFTYRASDGTAPSNIATVAISVLALADNPPVAQGDIYATAEDQPLTISGPGVLANDTDADADPLTAILVSAPSHGTVTLNPDGSFTYTPAPNYNGPDSFTYQASDGAAYSTPVAVSLTINALNDPPVGVADSYVLAEDTPLVIAGPGVLVNDTDADDDPLTAAIASPPAHGTVALNPDGSFTYTPSPNYNGPDSFTYRASDGNALSAPVTVLLQVAAVNDAPVADPDAYVASEDTPLVVAGPGVLANDSDPDGNPIGAVLVTPPAHGTVTLNVDGSFTYTPAPNYNGPDAFTYRASDGTAPSNIVTVSLTVNAVNDAPVANPDAYATPEDTPLVVAGPGVLANDTDAEGNPLTAVLSTPPAHGTVALNPDGSFTYTPSPNYSGPDSFAYRANDGVADGNSVTVSLAVAAVNDAPAAAADLYATAEDQPLTISGPGVLANDIDPDGDPLTAVLASAPSHGTVALNPDGSFTYTPAPDYHGPDAFSYHNSDGSLSSPVVTVSLTVAAANDAPVANPDAYAMPEDTPLVVAGPGVLANDSDPEGDPLTAALDAGPSHGTLTLAPDGSFTYTPAPGFSGVDSFSYRAVDGTAAGAAQTVTIVVNPAAARVVGLRRLGFHAQPTLLVVRFDSPMDAATAENLGNYALTSPGRDGRFGTRDDRQIPLRSATYDPTTGSVTIQTRSPLPLRARYELVMRNSGANGLTDALGRALVGDAGGRSAIRFNQDALAGPSVVLSPRKLAGVRAVAAAPSTRTHLSIPAIDAILASTEVAPVKPHRKGVRLPH